ncbi:hypothetical protein [Cellulomonas sp. NPDC058312]|jgi:hypothetical protein|uniref:hypothetical protein n=1 Tax=Cellulomonas sp. NPDC058312 TaxID=3346441 RepID=UPI0036E71233
MKTLSRAARVAEGKRKHAAALGALRHSGPAPLPVLPPEIEATIAAYSPQGKAVKSWDLTAPMCRTLARYYRPKSPENARNVMWHLSRYLEWVVSQPHRVDVTAALRLDEVDYPNLLDLYRSGRSAADSTAANLVSFVRRAVQRSQGVEPTPVPHTRSASVPLQGPEVPVVVQYAHQQRTSTNRRSLCFIVGLSLGAGLDGHDLALVRRHHLVVFPVPGGGDVLTVEVTDGTATRVAVVADVMRPTVELALAMHDEIGRGAGAYVLGTEGNRRSVVQTAIRHARAARPEDRPHVSCPRMRNTWLVAAMQAGIPVREVMQAAGLKYATTLVDLQGYCDPLDPAYVATLFANVHRSWRKAG